jgi:hypothetical protein
VNTPRTTSAVAVAAPKKKGRSSYRKYLLAAVIGVLLGLGAVIFCARIYNPFEAGLGERSLLVVTPPDADFVLFVPHVPDVLGRIRDRGFVKVLDEHRGFQEFLGSDFARRTGALEALRKAFAELDALRAARPLGLDLLGDVSGDELVLAGWAPEAPGGAWDFLATFRPRSWLVLAGVNIAVDRDLAERFVVPNAAPGVKFEHARDSAVVTLPQGRSFAFARVRDTVFVGTRPLEVARLKTRLERERLPDAPAARYRLLDEGAAEARSEVRALVRRTTGDEQLGLTQRLQELWGEKDVRLVQALLPRLGGEDLTARLHIDDEFILRMNAPEGQSALDDLAAAYQPFARLRLERAFAEDAAFLPAGTFAFARFELALPQFLAALFRRSEIFSPADLSLLRDGLATVPEFGTIEGFTQRFADLCDGGMTLGFFTQDREGGSRPAPGFAAVFSLRNEESLRALAETLRERVRRGAGDGRRQAVKDLVFTKSGDADLYEIQLPEGVLDHPDVTKLGFAIARGRFVFTNWAPALRDLGARLGGGGPSAESSEGLRRAFVYAPETVRAAWVLDPAAMYRWFDQSVDGWATLQTSDTGKKQLLWNAEAERQARAAGLKAGTPEFMDFVRKAYDNLYNQETRVRRPELKRQMQRYLDQFRDLGRCVGIFIGGRGEIEFGAALELAPQPAR